MGWNLFQRRSDGHENETHDGEGRQDGREDQNDENDLDEEGRRWHQADAVGPAERHDAPGRRLKTARRPGLLTLWRDRSAPAIGAGRTINHETQSWPRTTPTGSSTRACTRALRDEMHTKAGKDISENRLHAAAHSKNDTVRKQAELAEMLKGLRK